MRIKFVFLFWISCGFGFLQSQSILNYFNAQVINGQVILIWEILTGNTCDGIEIQHSTDSILFSKIGEIAGVCGSKTENISYEFKHLFPQKNRKNYYRLQLGGFTFSELETVEVLDFKNGYLLRPNPVHDKLQLKFDRDLGSFQIRIIDLEGHAIVHTQGMGSGIYLDASDWSPGVYVFTLQSKDLTGIQVRCVKL